MNLLVQLIPGAADQVRGGLPLPTELREIQSRMPDTNLALEPLHPDTHDDTLASWFRIALEDEVTAGLVAQMLTKSLVVASAYVEPLSAPPAVGEVPANE